MHQRENSCGKLRISSTAVSHYCGNKRKDIYQYISVGQVGMKVSFVQLVTQSTFLSWHVLCPWAETHVVISTVSGKKEKLMNHMNRKT